MRLIITILTLFFITTTSISQSTYYYKNLSSGGIVKKVCMLDSCGMAILFGDNSGKICINKYDCNEALLWTKCFAFSIGWGVDIIQVDDGGFVILSHTQVGSSPFMVITKLDQDGNLQWSKDFSTTTSNNMYSLVKSNTNTFITGGSGCTGQNTLLKLNANDGSIVWAYKYIGTVINMACDIVKTSDSNYAVLSFSGSSNTGLFKIDENGNLLWSHVYTFANEQWPYALLELPNDDLLITCQSKTLDSLKNDITLLKTDPFGNILFGRVLHHPIYESFGKESTLLNTGEIFLTGDIFMGGVNPNLEGTIVKLNASMDSILFTNHNGNFAYSHLGNDANYCISSNQNDDVYFGGNSDGASLIKIAGDGFGLCEHDTINYSIIDISVDDSISIQNKLSMTFSLTDKPTVCTSYFHFETTFCTFLSQTEISEYPFAFWPNPIQDFMHLEYSNNFRDGNEVRIYSFAGVLIERINLSDGIIDCRNLTSGIYVLEVLDKTPLKKRIKFIKY